jgi:hypothetical protein
MIKKIPFMLSLSKQSYFFSKIQAGATPRIESWNTKKEW